MNTLLTTNILLLAIVVAILFMTILVSILLIQLISTTRKVKDIIKEFDDDIHRTRSFFTSVKNHILDLFKKK